MPLFRRQSEKCRKRQQDQELLAQQDPEPRFDLSSCELVEVPSGVYAICKVLQKQVLLLHDNWLHGLSGGGDITDLSLLTVLDLHSNELKVLPEEMGALVNLKILDVSDNNLKDLPKSLSEIPFLQTLNLRKNKFKVFPEPVLRLKCLRTLDISLNEIDTLPVKLCYVKALEMLVLDTENMKFPTQEICKKSTAAIMMYLCGQAGIEFEHPSKYWLKIEAANKGLKSSTSDNYLNVAEIEAQMMEGVKAYQNAQDQKRKDVEQLEKFLQSENEAQAELAAKAAFEQRLLLSSITQFSDQDCRDLVDLNCRKEMEKEEFVQYLNEIEHGASTLLSKILDYNKKTKETEKLMQQMEEERMREEDWLKVRWEELQNIRKNEILNDMKTMLMEFTQMELTRQDVELMKGVTIREALDQENFEVGQMHSLIHYKDLENKKMVAKLAEEEELQKAAFEALLISQDMVHARIRSQIVLIESELAQLTAVEMDNRAKRMQHEINVVAEQRIALSAMLSQLLEESEKRKAELKKRLIEMEEQREDGQQDYWLAQFQRLLDWKPQSLIDKESQLEFAVKDILIISGAEDYIPLFARHRITIETMVTLSEDDLKQMGVHELGLRKAVLKNIACQQTGEKTALEKVREKTREMFVPVHLSLPSASTAIQPSAPIASPDGLPSLPDSLLQRQLSVTARGLHSECSICLDNKSNIIFLTCGHVCCCATCATPVKECPLCRAQISAKIRISLPST
ncbi:E3 ubiquitin-protein ligase LRSAM1 [Biomphalaria pfeifferi]|uniref:E3 ubiquitin-protein ligase LRSAM1 n=1 Tax=Biomphalaria pfeifferi TaxID=112525 RepID=A0AAD8C412_BIOPF|nr:E3 ubiquitin-protein ligase LRSAM1 [Biomphalaria pfeifferi]